MCFLSSICSGLYQIISFTVQSVWEIQGKEYGILRAIPFLTRHELFLGRLCVLAWRAFTNSMMNSPGRRNTGGHDNYLMNQQAALPEHEDGNEFMANSPNSYNFSQHSFNSYISQFSPPYSQQSNLTPSAHLSQYPSGHSNQSISAQTSLSHQPPQYISRPRYLQSPRYLPLRDALGEIDIESQESRNEGTMLSEPVIPPLDGFPDVREFDQLMKRYSHGYAC